MDDRLAQCTWPPLPERFGTALRHATQFIFGEFDPLGIVATGTIVRGTAHANSDLDLYVIHAAPYRRRVQRYFESVPAEIFVNPPSAIRAYFREEDRDGRRLTAHMLATGMVVYRTGPALDALCAEAREWLARHSPPSEPERVHARYAIASRLEDALDVVDADETTATMLLAGVVTAILEFVCKRDDGRIPRLKDLLMTVNTREPAVARLATAFFEASTIRERVDIALTLADSTIGVRGFFPWDSGPESLAE